MNPLIIWIVKNNPNNDPKFHQYEILIGDGNLIKDLLKNDIFLFIKLINFSEWNRFYWTDFNNAKKREK